MTTAERIKRLLLDHMPVDPDKITEHASIIDDLGADSLDLVELIMELEAEFGMEISDDDAEGLLTVGDAIKYVDRRLTA